MQLCVLKNKGYKKIEISYNLFICLFMFIYIFFNGTEGAAKQAKLCVARLYLQEKFAFSLQIMLSCEKKLFKLVSSKEIIQLR